MTYLGLRKVKQMIKKIYQYKLRTFINASHAIRWADGQGTIHPHTWEVVLNIIPPVTSTSEVVKFEDIELLVQNYLQKYAGQTLNDIAPFRTINPTLENFADVLFDELTAALDVIHFQLVQLDLGESAKRFYSISLAD